MARSRLAEAIALNHLRKSPMRGFLIHLTVYIVVIVGLAAINLIRNPIALAVQDLVLLMKFRRKRAIPLRPSTSDKPQNGV
jgi:hypothetical protein